MSLETRYRRLLLAYPRSYRVHRGAEMVATLLDGAAADQTRPTRREAADLLTGAARERLRLHDVPALAAGLRIAGAICLLLAAGFGASDWLLGPRGIASTVVSAGWLLAVIAYAAAPRAGVAAIVGGAAWLSTVVAIAVSPAYATFSLLEPDVVWQPDRYYVELVCGPLVVLALVLTGRVAGPVRWAVIPGGVAALALSAVLLDGSVPRPAFGEPDLRYPTWTHWAVLLPLIAFGIGVMEAIRRRSTVWLWVAALLAVPAPTMLLWRNGDFGLWTPPLGSQVMHRTLGFAQCVLASALVVVTASLAARYRAEPAPRTGRWALAGAGGVCLAVAGGSAVYLLGVAAYHGGVAPADLVGLILIAAAGCAGAYLPVIPRRILVAAAIGALIIGEYSGRFTVLIPAFVAGIGVLLVVGLVAPGGSRRCSGWAPGGVVALFAVLSWLTFNDPLVWPSAAAQDTFLPAVAGVALAPTVWWAGSVAVRGARWAGAVVAFAAALTWLMLLAGPLHDSRLIAAVVVAAMLGPLASRRVQRQRAAALSTGGAG